MKRHTLEGRIDYVNERAAELEKAAHELAATTVGTYERQQAQVVLMRRAMRYGIAVKRYLGGATE